MKPFESITLRYNPDEDRIPRSKQRGDRESTRVTLVDQAHGIDGSMP